jgi:hypothetical protein
MDAPTTLGRLKRWLEVKWSLWRVAIPVVCNGFLSLVCYTVGWSFSTTTSAIPFARGGAAATMIAIAFTLYNYRRALETSEQAARRVFERATHVLPLTGKASLEKVTEKLQQNTWRADRTITFAQAVILILATFVWGFGDLAGPWTRAAPIHSLNQNGLCP